MLNFLLIPENIFKWSDIILALIIYIVSIVMLIHHFRGESLPILIFGVFIFPIQFNIWFLENKWDMKISNYYTVLQIIYLLFLKLCILFSLLRSRD
ncbi:MAG: hypothetical protein DRP54_04215 [Spirochaetes bacterium]|nr:MAG: hypothetical protein DRP54_04215 [Spirochaetota bacterium]